MQRIAVSLLLAISPLIVLDPGHGGAQDGAQGPSGSLEKNVDLQLPDRVSWANGRKPDLFISVHLNSMPTAKLREVTEGIETYFLSASSSGESARRTAARENQDMGGAVKGPSSDLLAYILADLQRSASHAESSRLAYTI